MLRYLSAGLLLLVCVRADSWTDWDNDFNGHQIFDKSASGYAITGFQSYHNNQQEDRRWKISYTKTPVSFSGGSWTGWHNDFDGDLAIESSSQMFVGIQSQHDNTKEDRKFSFKRKDVTGSMQVSNCRWTTRTSMEGSWTKRCATHEFMFGMKSKHDNYMEDRWFEFKCCTVTKPPTPKPTSPPTLMAEGVSGCWRVGSNLAERDAACAYGLVCARQEHDNRNFGCEDHHCCVKEPTGQYYKAENTACGYGDDCEGGFAELRDLAYIHDVPRDNVQLCKAACDQHDQCAGFILNMDKQSYSCKFRTDTQCGRSVHERRDCYTKATKNPTPAPSRKPTTLAEAWRFLKNGQGGTAVVCAGSNRLACASDDGVSCNWGRYGEHQPYAVMSNVPEGTGTKAMDCPGWSGHDGSDACKELGCYPSEAPTKAPTGAPTQHPTIDKYPWEFGVLGNSVIKCKKRNSKNVCKINTVENRNLWEELNELPDEVSLVAPTHFGTKTVEDGEFSCDVEAHKIVFKGHYNRNRLGWAWSLH